MDYHLESKRRLPLRKALAGAISLLALVIFLVDGALANPPPVPRTNLPQIERDLKGKDSKVQLRALTDLGGIEGNLTGDLVRLLPRILQLCQSPDGEVAESALSVVAQFCWVAEARKEHGGAIVEVIGKSLQSKDVSVRKMAAYAAWLASRNQLVDEQIETALPILIAAADDREEYVRMEMMMSLGLLGKADQRVVAALRRALADPAMQVRRQAALALAEHARIGEAAIPELLAALRDSSGEVSGSAAHALGKMGEPAMEALLKAADDPNAAVRRLAIAALGSGHVSRYSTTDENSKRLADMVHRKLDDPDAAVRAEAAVRVSLFGSLEAKVAAIRILVPNSKEESLDGSNAYMGVHRCIRAFVSGLTDKDQAETAFRGLKQFDKDFLKEFLQQTQERFRGSERGDARPMIKAAAENGISPAHRELAAEMLSWLPKDTGK